MVVLPSVSPGGRPVGVHAPLGQAGAALGQAPGALGVTFGGALGQAEGALGRGVSRGGKRRVRAV